MDERLTNKVDKLWRKLRKLSHVEQLDVLAELTWRARTENKVMEDDGDDCLCDECIAEEQELTKEEVEQHVRAEKWRQKLSKMKMVREETLERRRIEKEGEMIEVTESSSPELKEKVFRAAWSGLICEGKVDQLDGHQYRVVFKLWQRAGLPIEGITRFILDPIK